MDERFEKILKKIDEQSKKSMELQKEVSIFFGEVKKTQIVIDGKMDEINEKIEKELSNFQAISNSAVDKINPESKNSVSDILNNLIILQDEYKTKIQSLITSIDEKSEKILKIWEELEIIKQIQKNANSTLGELERERNELSHNSDVVNLKQIAKFVRSIESKVAKLEKHAHTHMFGGIKI